MYTNSNAIVTIGNKVHFHSNYIKDGVSKKISLGVCERILQALVLLSECQ